MGRHGRGAAHAASGGRGAQRRGLLRHRQGAVGGVARRVRQAAIVHREHLPQRAVGAGSELPGRDGARTAGDQRRPARVLRPDVGGRARDRERASRARRVDAPERRHGQGHRDRRRGAGRSAVPGGSAHRGGQGGLDRRAGARRPLLPSRQAQRRGGRQARVEGCRGQDQGRGRARGGFRLRLPSTRLHPQGQGRAERQAGNRQARQRGCVGDPRRRGCQAAGRADTQGRARPRRDGAGARLRLRRRDAPRHPERAPARRGGCRPRPRAPGGRGAAGRPAAVQGGRGEGAARKDGPAAGGDRAARDDEGRSGVHVAAHGRGARGGAGGTAADTGGADQRARHGGGRVPCGAAAGPSHRQRQDRGGHRGPAPVPRAALPHGRGGQGRDRGAPGRGAQRAQLREGRRADPQGAPEPRLRERRPPHHGALRHARIGAGGASPRRHGADARAGRRRLRQAGAAHGGRDQPGQGVARGGARRVPRAGGRP